MGKKLERFFKPKSIAVVGASDEIASVGYSLFANIRRSFPGPVWPVNIKRASIQGCQAYARLTDLPAVPDLVVVATPASSVSAIVEEAGQMGIKYAVIISAGFAESGQDGQIMLKSVQATARHYGLRFLGPNCLGFLNGATGLNASFAKGSIESGPSAFVSQSGALCTAIMDIAADEGLGFSYFVSIGSASDLDFADLMDEFAEDKSINSVFLYIEAIQDSKRWIEAGRRLSSVKPLFVLKSGRTPAGAGAARSHTGSLSGREEAYDAIFRAAGAIRMPDYRSFLATMKLYSVSYASSDNLTIITNAGGPGVLTADAAYEAGLSLPALDEKTLTALDAVLPKAWSRSNPVDILGDASPEAFAKAVGAIRSNNTLLLIMTPQEMTEPLRAAELISEAAGKRPLVFVLMGGASMSKAREFLVNKGYPVYDSPETAISALGGQAQYFHLKDKQGTLGRPCLAPRQAKRQAEIIIEKALSVGQKNLDEFESKSILRAYGLEIPANQVLNGPEDANNVKLKYPLVLKAISPDILHKTELGAYVLGVKDQESVSESMQKIDTSLHKLAPMAERRGYLAEEMISIGWQLFCGWKSDPVAGRLLVFGWGGIEAELIKDVVTCLPIRSQAEALSLLKVTKIYQLLNGYRGQNTADIEKVCQALCLISRMCEDLPQILEFDINPISCKGKDVIVLDAKGILSREI